MCVYSRCLCVFVSVLGYLHVFVLECIMSLELDRPEEFVDGHLM